MDIKLGNVPASPINDTDNIIIAEGENIRKVPSLDVKKDFLGEEVLKTTAPKTKEAINELVQDLLESTGYGVVSGLTVSAQATPNMTVNVVTGVLKTATGARQVVAANAALAVTTANATNPRKDIVYISSLGVISYLQGTAAASPTAPATPTGGSLLAEIYVAANTTTITSANITDKRKILISTDWLNSQLSDMTNKVADSGWINLPLENNVTVVIQPRYRKIGKLVQVTGSVTNLTTVLGNNGIGGSLSFGTLPTGYRPSQTVYAKCPIQNTKEHCNFAISASTGGIFISYYSAGTTPTGSEILAFNMLFLID